METIIGLGQAGCAIADRFAQYPQYEVYKMDQGLKRTPRTYGLKTAPTPEEYEDSVGSLKRFLKNIDGDVLFAVSGCGAISGASLRILEQIKKCNIHILYIFSDPELLGETARMQQRVTFNVFQEYSRSGVFKKVVLADNTRLEEILGDLPIIGFYDKLNELLVPTMHMVNVLSHSDSIMDNISPPHDVSRIMSYGLVDFDTGEEKMFFDLDNVREKVYYYAINEKKLREQGGIHKKVIAQVKQNAKNTKTTYGIYPTQYDEDYVYCVAYSSNIQEK
mgnify:CR=1 FL=1|jgi:hypothetical protein|tara:strand:- start:55 stop:885 length:831 start_codon:yes stop_codon:yes gene_type:complete